MLRSYHIYTLERKSILNSRHIENATLATSTVGAFVVTICAITHISPSGLQHLNLFTAASVPRAGTVSVHALLDHC